MAIWPKGAFVGDAASNLTLVSPGQFKQKLDRSIKN